MDLYLVTQDNAYFKFIYDYCFEAVTEGGEIRGYKKEDYNLDNINTGKILLYLYKHTGEKKFDEAIRCLYAQLKEQPRTTNGGFWHKGIYPNQVWLDGLYMAMPFYTEAENMYHMEGSYQDITQQILQVKSLMKDEKSGLYYHGYDDSRQEQWADSVTGLSQCFWGRAIGWLAMALIDTLELLPDSESEKGKVASMYKELMDAVLNYQEEESGMWYQVMDQKDRPDNYLETSSTMMFAYSLLKGARLGYLRENHRERGMRAFKGNLEKYLQKDEDGFAIGGMCSVAGLGNTPYRDGSYGYYISERIVSNDHKGLGAAFMAYSEILRV
ncbi:MAG: glycosyl hydrolase family 88 [Clostridia bacterium]|nr:glycosyl hydrolase family 88 [Clostridia bacterium]